MQHLLLSVFLLVFAPTLWAQEPPGNLVPNWSFEILEPNMYGDTLCPSTFGLLSLAKYWYSAAGSVDYFNACSNDEYPKFGVPSNVTGTQSTPDSSNAYIRIAAFSSVYQDYKEFAGVELTQRLTEGKVYLWSIKVSLCDSMNFAVSRIGAYFSSEFTQGWTMEGFYNVEPQVENPIDNLLSDKVNWVTVQDTFTAVGTEQFMTIGFFRRDSEDNIQQVSNFPFGNYTWDESGYYIDNVELYEIGTTGIAEPHTPNTLTVYPNPTTDHLTIRTSSQPTDLRLLDPLGRTLLLVHPTQQDTRLDISTLPKSIYFLQAHFPDGTRTTHRVIIN